MRAVLLLLALCVPLSVVAQSEFTPQHVHLAWTGKAGEMMVSFISNSSNLDPSHITHRPLTASDTVAQYGLSPDALTNTVYGTMTYFQEPNYSSNIHNVILTGLATETRYYYKVGCNGEWSAVFQFDNKAHDLTYAVFGDFGISNDVSLAQLQKEASEGAYDAVLHVGDFAYDLDTASGQDGDDFMAAIEPFAATVPYMTCPGNHEHYENFTHYLNRFSGVAQAGINSGSNNNLWYSFDQELVHFVSISTEVWAYSRDDQEIANMLSWLEADLIKANQHRAERPWVILLGHKASWMDSVDWTQLEDLSHKYGVDLLLCGHQHNYNRMYPFKDGDVDKQEHHHYFDPKYLVQIVVGSPGCKEKISKGTGPSAAIAEYFEDYGYGHMRILNATHLYWEWQEIKADATISVKDYVWLAQSHHGPRPL